MRTACALTVSPSMLCLGGGGSAPGWVCVCLLGGGVSALGGCVSAPGGSALGVSAPGGGCADTPRC